MQKILNLDFRDKNDSIYLLSIKDPTSNVNRINELQKCIQVDKVVRNKANNEASPVHKMTKMEFYKSNDNKEKPIELPSSISYLPKRNGKISTSSLSKLPIPETAFKRIIKKELMDTDKEVKMEINNQNDLDLLSYKTNFIVKFSRNLENYDKIFLLLDRVSENNKKIAIDYYYRIKSLTEKKDKVIFNTTVFAQNFNREKSMISLLENWKENISIMYEFESYWQKIVELVLKELKVYYEKNIDLNKKVKDKDCFIINKENEINDLNDYIKKNDINYKALVKKKKSNEIKDLKSEYEKKEKLNIINMYRLEEEIKDLTNLLDKDKDYYNKYIEGQELLECRKKDIDELRVKFNQELEEKRLKIAYLKNEKSELQEKITELEKNLKDYRSEFENSKKEYLEYHTQIKILKQVVQEKNEILQMQLNEIEGWVVMHEKLKKELKEKNSHIAHLETRISELSKKNKK